MSAVGVGRADRNGGAFVLVNVLASVTGGMLFPVSSAPDLHFDETVRVQSQSVPSISFCTSSIQCMMSRPNVRPTWQRIIISCKTISLHLALVPCFISKVTAWLRKKPFVENGPTLIIIL